MRHSENHSCFTCHHFGGLGAWGAVWCLQNLQNRSQPEYGCCDWMRETGTDDEGDDPDFWKAAAWRMRWGDTPRP